MSTDDRAYYYRRAETELVQARQASNPEAIRVHFALATAYLERVGEAAPMPAAPLA